MYRNCRGKWNLTLLISKTLKLLDVNVNRSVREAVIFISPDDHQRTLSVVFCHLCVDCYSFSSVWIIWIREFISDVCQKKITFFHLYFVILSMYLRILRCLPYPLNLYQSIQLIAYLWLHKSDFNLPGLSKRQWFTRVNRCSLNVSAWIIKMTAKD